MERYENTFSDGNVYGAVVALLGRVVEPREGAVVIDLAAGHGAVAEVVHDRLGVEYVAVDVDPVGLASIRERGFTAIEGDLTDVDGLGALLERARDGRPVAAVTLLDGLEHLPNGSDVLTAIAAFAGTHRTPVVLSVPNNTHRDVGFKLALGQWGYTPTGLLDETHVHLYGEQELTRQLAAAGLHTVDREDFLLSQSDQHDPADNPMLMRGTSINVWMNSLRDAAEPNGRVNQFVRAYLAGPVLAAPEPAAEPAPRPLLSVLVRTQGRRHRQLAEAFSCLAGQTDQDFEVVVLAHHVNVDQQIAVERIIERQPGSLRERTRFVAVDHGSRATVLNSGFAEARGQYVVAFDDDDLVFAHWVESFRRLHLKHPGKVLRGVSGTQPADLVKVQGATAVRSEGSITFPYDREFSLVRHLVLNQTPFMTAAFPRGLFHHLGLRFDESLTTTEDWDYLIRSASLVGVADSNEPVAIYHDWRVEDSSKTEHDREEWLLNQYSIDRRIDSLPLLLPIGETRAIRDLVRVSMAPPPPPPAPAPEPLPPTEHPALAQRLVELVGSRSWRAAAPLRGASRAFGRGGPIDVARVIGPEGNEELLRAAIADVVGSRSWRWTSWMRRRGHR
jgi:hypothetical protein